MACHRDMPLLKSFGRRGSMVTGVKSLRGAMTPPIQAERGWVWNGCSIAKS